ncbi:hypothetical protein MANES_17G018312v8 [Manihot esculenta]|uniref:Uncharacterized protein n=1 Tax=Manihot esculenta TaxID=3983 RepID=A0ACB7G1X5_MANES|nr:hypothetical protein MANES_17G018312v8 [Manihot esculenta]
MHVRPPKEVRLATYKSPSDRKWASFLPILELRVLKLGSRFGELGDFKSLGSPHLKFWVAPTLDLQEDRTRGTEVFSSVSCFRVSPELARGEWN